MAYYACPHCAGEGCVFCPVRRDIDARHENALDAFLDGQLKIGLLAPSGIEQLRQEPSLRSLLANAIAHGQLLERKAHTPSLPGPPSPAPHRRFDILEVRDAPEASA